MLPAGEFAALGAGARLADSITPPPAGPRLGIDPRAGHAPVAYAQAVGPDPPRRPAPCHTRLRFRSPPGPGVRPLAPERPWLRERRPVDRRPPPPRSPVRASAE